MKPATFEEELEGVAVKDDEAAAEEDEAEDELRMGRPR